MLFLTGIPFNEVGDAIYSDIERTITEPINKYNSSTQQMFSGATLSIIRFIVSDIGVILNIIILVALLIWSIISYKYFGTY